MLPEIKLTISRNDKVIETVSKTIEKEQLVKSLEDFQLEANATLTKMIQELGDISKASGDGNKDIDDDDNYDDDDDDDEDNDDSSLSCEELKEHSKSKKKKHS